MRSLSCFARNFASQYTTTALLLDCRVSNQTHAHMLFSFSLLEDDFLNSIEKKRKKTLINDERGAMAQPSKNSPFFGIASYS